MSQISAHPTGCGSILASEANATEKASIAMRVPTKEDAQKDEFHMEEYKSLRAEVLIHIQHQFVIQKWVIVSLGIIYGLAFGITGDGGIKILPAINKHLLLFAGLVVSVFGAGFYAVTDYTLWNISEYLKKIENRFATSEEPGGWENFQGFTSGKRHIWGVHKSPFWWAVLFFSVGLLAYELIVKK